MKHNLKTAVIILFCLTLIAPLTIFTTSAQAEETKIFEIKIPFSVGAPVTAVRTDGSETEICKVVKLPTKTRYPSYNASAWAVPGSVCASAVNAVHILLVTEKGRGRTMSIIPQETVAPAAGSGASVIVSAKAGYGVFGGWAPPVGSAVFIEKPDGTRARISPENIPQENDIMIIEVNEDTSMPYMVNIENRPGGRVTAWHSRGYTILGRVVKPVSGTGRFAGSLFQRVGALRANHCGIIEVSTAPYGTAGAFQIVPWEHALNSKEISYVWTAPQYMIIAPADAHSQLKATKPLFKGALIPGTAAGEKLWDLWSTYGRKSLVLARYSNGSWQRVKPVAGKNNEGLSDITELRIYFPFTKEKL